MALDIPRTLQKVPVQLRIQRAEKGRKEIKGKMVVTCQEEGKEESVSVHRDKHLRGFGSEGKQIGLHLDLVNTVIHVAVLK